MKVKIPKPYRSVVEEMDRLEVGHADFFDGRSYQPIAQLINPAFDLKHGMVRKKRRTHFDGIFLEI